MIFETITICNMFSYYGHQKIDTRSPDSKKNIVLISGGNNFGKTSFLNSLKLLFTGAGYEPLRRAVQRSRMPSVYQYILGTSDDWWGIMNRRAKLEGETECGIKVTWRESDGLLVDAHKQWKIGQGAPEELLTITVTSGETAETLTGTDAQNFSDQRLPEDYVSLFLFDGEQIQELAEATRHVQQHQMERLLGLSAIDTLRKTLNTSMRAWQRNEMKPEAGSRLERLEGELKALVTEYDWTKAGIRGTKIEIEEIESSIKRIKRRIDGLSSFVHRHDEHVLKQQKAYIAKERNDLLRTLSEALPRDIVLLANQKLVEKAMQELDTLVSSEEFSHMCALEKLKNILPNQLFDKEPFPEPDIKDSAKAFYRYKLLSLLENPNLPEEHERSSLFTMEPSIAAVSREQLASYAQAESLRHSRTADLLKLYKFHVDLEKIDAEIMNAGALSADERARYEQYLAERDEQEKELDKLKDKQRTLELKLGGIERDKHKKQNEIKGLEEDVQKTAVTEHKVSLAGSFRALFGEMKDRRKQELKETLESAINKNFKLVMSRQRLIKKIELDDDFGLHYRDAEERLIGMGSLSAGTKQLIATALLWALSEVSGKQVPIVVDTPLARIDKLNQDALLKNYYPNAGTQVIVLPTDSEIDRRKFSLIAEHVYKIYRLTNGDGEHSVAEDITDTPEKLFMEA